MDLPEDVRYCLLAWFGYPDEQVFGQVCTCSYSSPHTRTMMLYDITKQGELIFVTSTSSRKWQDLNMNPNVAICFFKKDMGQITLEGTVKLITSNDNSAVANKYWEKLSPYWQQFYRDKSSSFGVIIITPQIWEVLHIRHEDYLRSKRKQFKFLNGIWKSEDLSPE